MAINIAQKDCQELKADFEKYGHLELNIAENG